MASHKPDIEKLSIAPKLTKKEILIITAKRTNKQRDKLPPLQRKIGIIHSPYYYPLLRSFLEYPRQNYTIDDVIPYLKKHSWNTKLKTMLRNKNILFDGKGRPKTFIIHQERLHRYIFEKFIETIANNYLDYFDCSTTLESKIAKYRVRNEIIKEIHETRLSHLTTLDEQIKYYDRILNTANGLTLLLRQRRKFDLHIPKHLNPQNREDFYRISQLSKKQGNRITFVDDLWDSTLTQSKTENLLPPIKSITKKQRRDQFTKSLISYFTKREPEIILKFNQFLKVTLHHTDISFASQFNSIINKWVDSHEELIDHYWDKLPKKDRLSADIFITQLCYLYTMRRS